MARSKKKLYRKATDKISKEYWAFVERVAKEIEKWPKWKQKLAKKGLKYD